MRVTRIAGLGSFSMPLLWVVDANALTAATKYAFGYDTAGRLAVITDANGLVTQIERDPASGQATAIVAPNGQRTELTVNADGYLEGIDEPGGIHRGFTYGSGEAAGLLASYQNPRGNTSSFTYDELGRVTGESMPGGCSWNIQRSTGPSATSSQTPVKVSLTSAGQTVSFVDGSTCTAPGTDNTPAPPYTWR
jgi:YD repeat-containing protein